MSTQPSGASSLGAVVDRLILGGQIFSLPGIAPQLMSVTAGTLNETNGFKPQMNVYQFKAWP